MRREPAGTTAERDLTRNAYQVNFIQCAGRSNCNLFQAD